MSPPSPMKPRREPRKMKARGRKAKAVTPRRFDFAFELSFVVRADSYDHASSVASYIRDDLKGRDFGNAELRNLTLGFIE